MLQKQGGSIMSSVKVFVPYGAVGLNCTEEAFEAGLAMKPDIISSDAGSTDSGPYYLGSGHGKYSIADVKRDLKRNVYWYVFPTRAAVTYCLRSRFLTMEATVV